MMSIKATLPMALLALAACGGADSTTPLPTGPTPEQAACDTYCDAAHQRGCPKSEGCFGACMALFDLGCPSLLADVLSCAATSLTDECVPRGANGKLTCDAELNSYVGCVPIEVGVPFETCGPSSAASESVEAGCEGVLQCEGLDLRVQCDATNACTCTRNGAVVGTCDNILSSAYFCAPHESCCSAFFRQ